MSTYLRPRIDDPVFHDAGGRVIDYGNRWGGPPPDDTYSVDTHPERFAPLHTIAAALIDHLCETYDVAADEAADVLSDLLHPPSYDVVRAVRLSPDDPSCAALTIVCTAYPGVYLHAGLLHDFHYPVCGCDACDETWQAASDDLEQQVIAVVNGRYREAIRGGRNATIEHAFTYPDGASSGQSGLDDLPPDRVAAAKAVLDGLPEGWAAWSRRVTPSS